MNRYHILLLIVCCGCTSCAWKLARPEERPHAPEPELSPEAVYWDDKPGIQNNRFNFDFDDNERAWWPRFYFTIGAVEALHRRTRAEVLAFSFKPNALKPQLLSGPSATTNLVQQVNALVARYQGSNIVQTIEVRTHKRVLTKRRLFSRAQEADIEDSREYLWVRTLFTGKRTSITGDDPKERVEWILYVTDYNPDRLGELDCPLAVIALEMPLDTSLMDRRHLLEVLERSVRNIFFYR